MTMEIEKIGQWLTEIIVNFVRSPENSIRNAENDPAWAEPLVGLSRGDDPIFQFFKEDIGSFYWTPLEIFKRTFPDSEVSPDELSVICWVLPQTEKTKAANRKATHYPAEAWSRSRHFGEEFNLKLARHVVSMLLGKGYEALAPIQSPFWGWQTSERYGFSSNWSERHAAHASGLGTFGLCDGLITARGKAMRCGSVIAKISAPPTKREYKGHRDYCPFYPTGLCGKCIDRCPVGAITKIGHDKMICRNYVFDVIDNYAKKNFGFSSYGCGLCQTGVPCESRIPSRKDLK